MAQVAKIPVIDISAEGDQTQVARELVEAAIEHGFVYIRNTGKDIPVAAVEGAFDVVRVASGAVGCLGRPPDRLLPGQATLRCSAERERGMHHPAEQPRRQ